MSRERDIADRAAGVEAERLLDALQKHVGGLEQRYMQEWLGGNTVELRELAWHRVSALRDVAGALTIAVQNGKLAQKRLDQSK